MGVSVVFDRQTGEVKTEGREARALRAVRYQLQQQSGEILGRRHRVNYCHAHLGNGKVRANVREHEGQASFGNLAVCGNVWACPVCASRVSERRGEEIRQAMAWAKVQGFETSLVTLTIPHGVGDDPKTLVDLVTGGWRSITGHKAWNGKGGPRSDPGLKHAYGVDSYIRALEVTHGANGWHPHIHLIVFSKKPLDRAFKAGLYWLWAGYMKRNGHPVPSIKHGVDVRDGSEAGDYVSKYGSDGELIERRDGGGAVTWDMADEATKGNLKRAKNGNRKPFQILQDSLDDDRQSAYLFKLFVTAFRGKSQLQWTPKLKARVGLDEKSDEQLAEEAGESNLMFSVPNDYWVAFRKACKLRAHQAGYKPGVNRSTFLRLAESGGVYAAAKYLVWCIRGTNWRYRTGTAVDRCITAIMRETEIELSQSLETDHA